MRTCWTSLHVRSGRDSSTSATIPAARGAELEVPVYAWVNKCTISIACEQTPRQHWNQAVQHTNSEVHSVGDRPAVPVRSVVVIATVSPLLGVTPISAAHSSLYHAFFPALSCRHVSVRDHPCTPLETRKKQRSVSVAIRMSIKFPSIKCTTDPIAIV